MLSKISNYNNFGLVILVTKTEVQSPSLIKSILSLGSFCEKVSITFNVGEDVDGVHVDGSGLHVGVVVVATPKLLKFSFEK